MKTYGFDMSKSVMIHNGYIINRPVKASFNEKFPFTILTVGRFVPQKDYYTALLAIKLLYERLIMGKRTISLKYIIIGFGELKQKIIDQVASLNIENIIEIVDNPANVLDYYEKSDIYLSTSLFEGLSNSILEALEFSLPIVCTDVGDNSELVIHGENGYLTKVKDYKSISIQLENLICNAALRENYGKRSY